MSDDDLAPDARPADRRDTPRLIERLLDPALSAEERTDVVEALAPLEDPRAVAPLEEAALDAGRAANVRAAALAVLECVPRDDPPAARVQAWVGSRDVLTRIYGLSHCGAADATHVLTCVQHPVPGVRTAALRALVSITRTRALVEAAAQALQDPAGPVREMACRIAYFDEPYPLLRGVIRLLDDRDDHVRRAAYDALADFPSVAALLAVAEPRGGPGDRPAWRSARTALIARIAAEVPEHDGAGRRRLTNWLRPVAWILDRAGSEEELHEQETGAPPGPEGAEDDDEGRPPVDLARAARALADPDTHPDVLRSWLLESDWSGAGTPGREIARQYVDADAWLLRFGIVTPLSDLGDEGTLTGMAYDREPVIARRALAGLARLGSGAGLDAARALLAGERSRAVVGEEALAYVLRFGGPDETERLLIDELSRPDDRDGLFNLASRAVAARGLRTAVPALLALVNAPVVASVRAHVTALRALRSLGHPAAWIDLGHLEDLDHLAVQAELARWGHGGGRWG